MYKGVMDDDLAKSFNLGEEPHDITLTSKQVGFDDED